MSCQCKHYSNDKHDDRGWSRFTDNGYNGFIHRFVNSDNSVYSGHEQMYVTFEYIFPSVAIPQVCLNIV